jgi:hypothetical protein
VLAHKRTADARGAITGKPRAEYPILERQETAEDVGARGPRGGTTQTPRITVKSTNMANTHISTRETHRKASASNAAPSLWPASSRRPRADRVARRTPAGSRPTRLRDRSYFRTPAARCRGDLFDCRDKRRAEAGTPSIADFPLSGGSSSAAFATTAFI